MCTKTTDPAAMQSDCMQRAATLLDRITEWYDVRPKVDRPAPLEDQCAELLDTIINPDKHRPPEPVKLAQLIRLVIDMRRHQQAYFKTRARGVLNKAMAAEHLVDRWIASNYSGASIRHG